MFFQMLLDRNNIGYCFGLQLAVQYKCLQEFHKLDKLLIINYYPVVQGLLYNILYTCMIILNWSVETIHECIVKACKFCMSVLLINQISHFFES